MLFPEWKNQKTLLLALNYIIMSLAKHPNTWGSPWWSVTPSFFFQRIKVLIVLSQWPIYFFLSISRNNWNWLGVPDFQTDTQCHQNMWKGWLVVKPLIIPYYYALHIFSLFELDHWDAVLGPFENIPTSVNRVEDPPASTSNAVDLWFMVHLNDLDVTP